MIRIAKVEIAEFYIKKNITSMENFASKKKEEIEERFKKNPVLKNKDKKTKQLDKRKDLELEKVRYLNKKFIEDLNKIIKRFNFLDKLDDFYIGLIETYDINIKNTKDILEEFKKNKENIDMISSKTEYKIKKTKTLKTIDFLIKKYLGKITNIFKKNEKNFVYLDKIRKVVNSLPNLLNLYTATICGYPNVGKSTLLKKLTGSDVQIQSFPFTTKNLLIGYIEEYERRGVQVVDTPGLLSREQENNIEKRSKIVIEKKSDLLIYVIDITETCGYKLEKQLKLLRKLQKINKNVVIYFSKTELFEDYHRELQKEITNKFDKLKTFEESNKLKKYLLKFKIIKE